MSRSATNKSESDLELLIGLLQEVDLFHVLSFFDLPLFVQFLLGGFGVRLRFFQLSLKVTFVLFELSQLKRDDDQGTNGIVTAYLLRQLGFALLRHQCLAHAESDTALVERLIGSQSHLQFVADTQEE